MKIVSNFKNDKYSYDEDYTTVEQYVEGVKHKKHKKIRNEKKNIPNYIDGQSICSESTMKVNECSKENKANSNFLSEEDFLSVENNMDWEDVAFDMNLNEVNEPDIDFSDEISENAKKLKISWFKLKNKKQDASSQLVSYLQDESYYFEETHNEHLESGLPKEKEISMNPNEDTTTSNFTQRFSNISNLSSEKPLKNVYNTLLCYFLICMFVLIWVYVVSLICKVIQNRFKSAERRRQYSLFIQQNKR
ncbi:hypothetical protein NBO_805g0001 [Nosema bombycis CQ1]|uniref:Uncharacterized protein n=1 Tax=Nosema bombycis (strain CQ1 / CVCC 102059) TaxID=578461 RepID=R0MCP1_NOSB1|nr:hypothetical protein NBO_805g0001 [Nosema bombycis CQ1]|eukprot:EOB11805.1 hypothetical protein NBO_805g0001 [Nosema bombycis CQ1]